MDEKNSWYLVTVHLVLQLTIVLCAGHKETEALPCTSIVAMVIESAALYATWLVVSIVVYAMDNPGQSVMLTTLCSVQVHLISPTLDARRSDAESQVICPVLIVYRVSNGLGWETRPTKLTSMTPMAFAQGQIALDSMLETQDTPEQQQENIPDMVFARSTQRVARPGAV